MKRNIRGDGVSSFFSGWRPFWHLRRSMSPFWYLQRRMPIRIAVEAGTRNRGANMRKAFAWLRFAPLVAFLAFCLLDATVARADVYGRIRGTVTDPTGAVVPKV